MTPFKIFIGWDSREPIAFSVLAHSIVRRATIPVSIIPLALNGLQHVYTRERGPTESTEFSLTRFLVPSLSHYEGFSLFMDSDMLCQIDIGDLWLHLLANPGKAVYVCPHDYTPKPGAKFLGHTQTAYPRKNWSSFMVFDNARCKTLTPEYVNDATGLALHRLQWTTDALIGQLPLDFNWLVGEYPHHASARVLHYTLGGPWFPETRDCDHADDWWTEYRSMLSPLVTVPALKVAV
jgi:hypothetical protein